MVPFGKSPCLSDGMGTKEISNMGVLCTRSAPNSEEEHDFEPGGIRIRRSKRRMDATRRSTRTGKQKGVSQTLNI